MVNFTAEKLTADKVNGGVEYQLGDAPQFNATNAMVSGILYSYEETNDLKNQTANNFSNTLKGLKSGEIVSITDVSPIEHTLNVNVSSENLIPYPYLKTTHTINGITFTDNGDGTVTANGTATGHGYFVLATLNLKKGTYFLSGAPKDGIVGTQLYLANDDYSVYKVDNGNGVIVEITDEKAVYNIAIDIKAGTTTENGVYKPQLELGTVATDYKPYVDVSKVKLIKSGKNLLNPQILLNNGGKPQDDGSIYFKNSNAISEITLFKASPDIKQITISYDVKTLNDTGSSGTRFLIYFTDGSRQYVGNVLSKDKYTHISVSSHANKVFERLVGDYGSVNNSTWLKNIQIENNASETNYMPYEKEEYLVNADGTVEGVNSIYPTTTLTTDNNNAIVSAEYNKDLNKAFAELYNAIISLGGNV